MRDEQQHWRAPAIVAAAESQTPAGATPATSHPDRRAKLWAPFLLLFGGGVWGVTFSLAKIAAAGGAHPLGITFWQAVLGVIFLLCFNLARRRPFPMGRRFLVFYLVCGLIGTAVPSTLFFYAAAHVPAGVLAITIASVPILTFAAALAFQLDRMAVRRVFGILLGLLAVVLMMAPESGLPEASAAPWILVAVLASACYAVENISIALRRPSGCDAYTILCGMLLMAALVLVPVVMATHSFVLASGRGRTRDYRHGRHQRRCLWTVHLFGEQRRAGVCQPDGLRGHAFGHRLGHRDFRRTALAVDLGRVGGHDGRPHARYAAHALISTASDGTTAYTNDP
jgi:drug/metabolite transporter (DMT)-like permease